MVRLGECVTLIRLDGAGTETELPALVTGVWGGSSAEEINCVSIAGIEPPPDLHWGLGRLEIGKVEHHPRVRRAGLHGADRRCWFPAGGRHA